MKEDLFKLIEEKCKGSKPLYLVLRGSHAYGTNLETSDMDYGGVFIQSMDDILGTKYVQQINDDKNDTVIYELRRFLELCSTNNPNILELLNTPKECIIYKDPIFDIVLENRDKFITKLCANSFGGYASQQIKKSKGQDKKQNWEKSKVEKKNPIDFCYIHVKDKSVPLSVFLKIKKINQKFCGLSKIPHSRDTYALFYDKNSYNIFNPNKFWSTIFNIKSKLSIKFKPMGYKGISFEYSNDIRLSSIPIESLHMFIGFVSYNKDGYAQHCLDWKSYQTWIKERNDQRWIDVKSHGQKIDGKNMMHCRRLMDMSREIAEGKGILVYRDNFKDLISIRKGEVDLDTLISHIESEIKEIDLLFQKSNLPDSVDNKLVEDILIKIRKSVYNIL